MSHVIAVNTLNSTFVNAETREALDAAWSLTYALSRDSILTRPYEYYRALQDKHLFTKLLESGLNEDSSAYMIGYSHVSNEDGPHRHMTLKESLAKVDEKLSEIYSRILGVVCTFAEKMKLTDAQVARVVAIIDEHLAQDTEDFWTDSKGLELRDKVAIYLLSVISKRLQDGEKFAMSYLTRLTIDESWYEKATGVTYENFVERHLYLGSDNIAEVANEVRKIRKKAVMLLKEIRDINERVANGEITLSTLTYSDRTTILGEQPIELTYGELVKLLKDHVTLYRTSAINQLSTYIRHTYRGDKLADRVTKTMRAIDLINLYDASVEGPKYMHSAQWKLYHDLCKQVMQYKLADSDTGKVGTLWDMSDLYKFSNHDEFKQWVEAEGSYTDYLD